MCPTPSSPDPEADPAAGLPPELAATLYLSRIGADLQLENLEAATSPSQTAQLGAINLSSSAYRARQIERLERAFKRVDRESGRPDVVTEALRSSVLRQADPTLAKLANEKTTANMEHVDYLVLEALVRSTGRPSFIIQDDNIVVDLKDPDFIAWQESLALGRDLIKETIPAVGRIDLGGIHVGTGFVVGKGLVMTNRHVAEEFASEIANADGTRRWHLKSPDASIDFACELSSKRTRRFSILGVALSGPHPINHHITFSNLDLALLNVARTNLVNDAFPTPLKLASDPAQAQRLGEIYIVGYPGQPKHIRQTELNEALQRIFQFKYGVKRLAPGAICTPLGQLRGDAKSWVFGHDATMVGGNSGACVVALDDTNAVVGLHFGGQHFSSNFAHALAAVPQLRAATAPKVNWR